MRTPGNYETDLHASFDYTLREAEDYFRKKGRLHETPRRLVSRLEETGIPYALVGGLALAQHGYVRMARLTAG